MQQYRVPLNDMFFLLRHFLRVEDGMQALGVSPSLSYEDMEAIAAQAAKMAEQVVLPINQPGDREGCRITTSGVVTPAGYRAAFKRYAADGWLSLTAHPDDGGQGLPDVLGLMVQEMISSASIAFADYIGLFNAGYMVLRAHADEGLRQHYIPKILSGDCGTAFCLTEPHCGTDIGLVKSRAEPSAGNGYRITGNKIFVSAGDHDLTDEIIYFVLARLPNAPEGPKGLSLFLVPRHKQKPASQGQPITTGRLEHKMGYTASATVEINFDGAEGWLIGQPNNGLVAMFTMVNHARIMVAGQGVCGAEPAYQMAAHYAKERLQGRALKGPAYPQQPADPIIVHPDVRRMLLSARAYVEGGRALYMWAAWLMDCARLHHDPDQRTRHRDMLALITPVLKSTLSDLGFAACNDMMQIFGGHGYIRDTGIEQYVRDVRLARIQEGANGILALDLVLRRLMRSGQASYRELVAMFHDAIGEARYTPGIEGYASALETAVTTLEQATAWILSAAADDLDQVGAGGVDYQSLFGLTLLGWAWLRMATIACQQGPSTDFFAHKLQTAAFFFSRLKANMDMHAQFMRAGANVVMAPDASYF